MLIERVWAANDYRNFHYLVACPESGEALAIDPLEWGLCLSAARARGWTVTQVLNTHEHADHTGGNAGMIGATGAGGCASREICARGCPGGSRHSSSTVRPTRIRSPWFRP